MIVTLSVPRARLGVASVSATWQVALLVTLCFFAYGWLRFVTLHSQSFDLAFFDQVVWNLSRGNGFASSFIPYSFLGQHFSPALLIFVPLYWALPSPLWLVLGQSLALGIAVVPLHALGRAHLDESKAWAIVIAYSFSVGISRAVGYDFHTETLAVPFVFLALLASDRGQWTLFWACAVVPVLAKEDGALVAFGVGLLVAITSNRKVGLGLMAIAVFVALALVLFLMPGLREGQAVDLGSRYAYLGGGGLTGLIGALRQLTDPAALAAALTLLVGVGFLPLGRPVTLLAALPAVGLALLSSGEYQHRLLLHYSIQATPLIFAAAIFGWRRLRDWRPVMGTAGIGLLLAGTALLQIQLSPLTGPLGLRSDGFLDFARADRARAAAGVIPPGAGVAAGPDVLTLLAERPVLAQLPGANDLEWLITDASRPLPWRPAEAGYGPVAVRGEFTVWRRQP